MTNVKEDKKQKIAIYYDSRWGRNDGPPLYYFNALKKFKEYEVLHLLPEGDISLFGKMDYHFWIDWGEDGLPVDHNWKIPDDGGKKIYVISDHHLDEKKYRLNKAKDFDFVFLNQKWYFNEYKNAGIKKVFYLPHAAEPKAYPHFSIIKKWDICFIGHLQDVHKGNTVNLARVDFLDYMFRKFPNFYFGTRNPAFPGVNLFEDAAKKFCQSKVVLNISIGNDVNMRFFEVLCAGSFLLTNWVPELKSLRSRGLIDGVHYRSYKTLRQAVSLTNYYLEHDKEREVIAKVGRKAFLEGHTYKHRIEEILKIIKEVK